MEAVMNQYVFSGRVVLNGCQFIIEAETEEEAREKVRRGEWGEVETAGGEFVDWSVTRLLSTDKL